MENSIVHHKGWREAEWTYVDSISLEGWFEIKLHLHVPISWKQFLVQLTRLTFVTLRLYCDLKRRKTSLWLLNNTLRSTENRREHLCPAACWHCVLWLRRDWRKWVMSSTRTYHEAQSSTAANSSNDYYPPFIYNIYFHLPVSYLIRFFFLSCETGGHINICSWCSQSNAVPQW